MRSSSPARTRFAPSPTGRLHIGSGRTALYAYLLAKQTGGQFLLRLEDTDQKRYVPESEAEIIEGLHWLGLEWDEGFDIGGPHSPYRQSERREIYQTYAKQLIDNDKAYYCFCTPERLSKVRQELQKAKKPPLYDGTCRKITKADAQERVNQGEKHVVRFKTPKTGSITVMDELRGEITVNNEKIDDFILVKSDGLALYHLAAMVDDFEMEITHVIRGSEWLATFPLHVHILQALELPVPKFYHLSVFLKPSGKGKMSKRESAQMVSDGFSIFVTDLEENGYLPEAVVNWIALMGWSFDDHTEFFSMEDLIDKFDTKRLNPSPAAINFQKFDHFNGLHIRNLSHDELQKRIKPYFINSGIQADDATLAKIVPIIHDRIRGLDEAPEIAGFFFSDEVKPDLDELVGKNLTRSESADIIKKALDAIETITDFTTPIIDDTLRNLVDDLELKAGQVFGILRIAVTGQRVSPPLFETMEIIGKEIVIQRIYDALQMLETA